MTEISIPAGSEPAARVSRELSHPRTLRFVQISLLLAAAALAVLTSSTATWNLEYLGVLIFLSALSDLTAAKLPSGVFISGSFLGIMLAAVLLGGPPAAIVGTTTIAIGWLRTRERSATLRQNLLEFAWFPLLTGLLFHWASESVNLGPSNPSAYKHPAYYLIVFGTFMVALALNVGMLTVYTSVVKRRPFFKGIGEFTPTLSAELASAVLTAIAVLTVWKLDIWGLVAFAIVLVVFQYLIGELLKSQQRGEELRVMATTDDLTGLANRKGFGDRIDHEIAMATGASTAFGVMLLDLDHFKDINDTLGHQYGDDLLKDLGPRLKALIGDAGYVARFGGDEFAIMAAERTQDVDQLARIVTAVLKCVREPVAFDDITLEVDGSIGIARYPNDGRDAQTLLRRADIAMYAAKEHRDGHRFYEDDQDRHSVSRLSMVGDFRRALEKTDEIIVHFHPIVDLGTNTVHGAEALVRWQHPTAGLLQPGSFLEIVEQTGLIGALTDTVLDKSIAECAAWHAAGHELTVSVNLSVRNLHDPMLTSYVAQMLDRHCLPPSALKLEITESMIMSDPQRALATVTALGELGVRLAVDDFGTGHSSLANLRMLPVHELKIDRSFVTPMLSDDSDGVIVRSTIDLGHALGLKVIAEGVEDARTLQRLEEIKCDRAQGHFFSKPIPPIEFMRWVSRYEAAFLAA
jgi:diguanylate cyclase (GGDEF)-like protein